MRTLPRDILFFLGFALCGQFSCEQQPSDTMFIVEHLNGITDGRNRTFNVRRGLPEPGSITLFRNGLLDTEDQFQVLGQTLTFTTTPEKDAVLLVRYRPLNAEVARGAAAPDIASSVAKEELSAAIQREVHFLTDASAKAERSATQPVVASRVQPTAQAEVASTRLLERVLDQNRRKLGSTTGKHRGTETEDDSGVEGFADGSDSNVFSLPLLNDAKHVESRTRAMRYGSAPDKRERLNSIRMLTRTLSEHEEADY